jgi:hypothetical protein
MADEKSEETAEAKPGKKRLSRDEAKCSVEGCKRPYRAKSYCNVHYKAWRRGELEGHKARYKTCSKEGCRKPATQHGLCDEHFAAGKGGEAAAAPAA